jgi:hypothetical protein
MNVLKIYKGTYFDWLDSYLQEYLTQFILHDDLLIWKENILYTFDCPKYYTISYIKNDEWFNPSKYKYFEGKQYDSYSYLLHKHIRTYELVPYLYNKDYAVVDIYHQLEKHIWQENMNTKRQRRLFGRLIAHIFD